MGVELAQVKCNCFNFCPRIVEEVYSGRGFAVICGRLGFVVFIKMNQSDVIRGVFQQRLIFGVVRIDFWEENVVMVSIWNKRRLFPGRIKKIMFVKKSFVTVVEKKEIIIFIILLCYVLLDRFKMRLPHRKRWQQGRKPA